MESLNSEFPSTNDLFGNIASSAHHREDFSNDPAIPTTSSTTHHTQGFPTGSTSTSGNLDDSAKHLFQAYSGIAYVFLIKQVYPIIEVSTAMGTAFALLPNTGNPN